MDTLIKRTGIANKSKKKKKKDDHDRARKQRKETRADREEEKEISRVEDENRRWGGETGRDALKHGGES